MAKLVSLDTPVLRNYLNLYRREWPKYCQEFNILSTIIKFKEIEPKLKHISAYTLPIAEARDLGLFLILDRYQLFVGCLGDSLELLELALHELDWTKGMLCTSIPSRYLTTLSKVIRVKNLQIKFQHESNLYYMPRERALQFPIDCPEGFQLRALSESDAPLIDGEWAYNHEGSLYFIQRQIRHCASFGLYEQQTGKLVAWCLRTQDGLLAVLQVDAAYKRRGLGTVLVRALSRHIAALGEDITTEIYPGNRASTEMFLKLGFQVIDQCHWVDTLPVTGKFSWPEGE